MTIKAQTCEHPSWAIHHTLKVVGGRQTNIVQDRCTACQAIINETEDHELDFMVKGDRHG